MERLNQYEDENQIMKGSIMPSLELPDREEIKAYLGDLAARVDKEFERPAPSFIPMSGYVLLKPETAPTTFAGGELVLPESSQNKSFRAKVLAVSDTCELPLAAGNIVLYSKYAGAEFKLGGETLLVIQEKDILGVIYE